MTSTIPMVALWTLNPNGCPMDADTVRALLVILDHVNLDKASDEISDAWHALLEWVDGYC